MLRELKEVVRFRKLPREERELVFYAEHEGYYPYFKGIIGELIKKYEQPFCYVTSDPEDPILKWREPKIRVFFLKKLLPFFMAFVDCRVLVMTLTDLNCFHLKRSRHPVRYVYVFHSLVSTHMMYREGAFDHYDVILCAGPHQREEIGRREDREGLPAKELVEAGYYRLERVYRSFMDRRQEGSPSPSGRTILIAPSWGKENVIESCARELVEMLLGEGHEVIVRPHPETVRRSPELISSLAAEFGSRPFFTLETSVATDDSLLRADVLICDCSGVALEYALGTERPVLFIDVPLKIQNNNFRNLGLEPVELSLRSKIGMVIPPGDLFKVPPAVSRLLDEKEAYQRKIAGLRDAYVYHFGRSAEIGARTITGLILSGKT